MTISAGALLAEEPGAGSALRIAAVALIAAALGALAWRRFARRLPVYPRQGSDPAGSDPHCAPRLRDRRGRLQPRAAVAGAHAGDRPAGARGHRVPVGRARLPGAHGRLLLVDAHRRGAARARDALQLRAAARRPLRVGLRRARAERPPRPAGRHRAPARPVRRGRRELPSPRCSRPSGSTTRWSPPRARWSSATTPTCSCSSCSPPTSSATCAACATASTSTSSKTTDRHVADFLAWLGERGKLDDATVILMADHGQGRGIGGHGHLDWGESPVPFVVHGAGAVPGAVSREPHNVCELAATVSALLGVEPPAQARGRALVPALQAVRPRTAVADRQARCLAIVPAKDEAAAIGGGGRRTTADGVRHERGRAGDRRRLARRHGGDRPRRGRRGRLERASRTGWARPSGRASPPRATAATTPRSTSTATASTTRPTSSACSTRSRAGARST